MRQYVPLLSLPALQNKVLLHISSLLKSRTKLYTTLDIECMLFSESKEVFQHDGALEEIDEEVYQIIKKEKGRQVSLGHANIMPGTLALS